jgi:hypothetical protein
VCATFGIASTVATASRPPFASRRRKESQRTRPRPRHHRRRCQGQTPYVAATGSRQ